MIRVQKYPDAWFTIKDVGERFEAPKTGIVIWLEPSGKLGFMAYDDFPTGKAHEPDVIVFYHREADGDTREVWLSRSLAETNDAFYQRTRDLIKRGFTP